MIQQMLDVFDVVVKNGEVWSSAGSKRTDVGIKDGKVVFLGDLSVCDATAEIDASGMWVLPGAIDTQVHFREPGLEHKEDIESGTRSAVCGGVTTVFEMPNTDPPTIGAGELGDKLDRASGRAWTDHAFFLGACAQNIGSLASLESLPGSPGIKAFMGSSTGPLLVSTDELMRGVLSDGQHRVAVHSEDEAILRSAKAALPENPHVRLHPVARPVEAAVNCTRRLIALSEETGRPVHILHISTAEELPLIRDAKARGVAVTCEATPHHLTFDASDYETLGTLIQMNPPIRQARHREALWEAVLDGTVDVFGSDHAPHILEEKQRPYPASPSGMPGVQTLLPVLLDWVLRGRLPMGRLVAMLCETPANLYGIEGKGRVEPGFDADLVVIDPRETVVWDRSLVQSKCGWSPYEGKSLKGRVEHVVLRGTVMVRSGRLVGSPIGKPVEFVWKGSSMSAR